MTSTGYKMRSAGLLLLTAFLCGRAMADSSTRIISVTGPNPADGQDVRLDANSVVAVHWTSAVAYTNVTISAQLYCTPCGKADTSSADVYLMTDIGGLATVQQRVASAHVTVTGRREFVPVLTGVTLLAGSYYLVIYSPTLTQPNPQQPGAVIAPAVAWGGTSDAAAAVTAASGTTRETALIYASNAMSPFINFRFPPASYFERSPTTPDYDLNGAFNLQYTVVSMPSAVVPHVAAGSGWKTSFALVNFDQAAVTYSLKFWDDSGAALSIPLGQGSSSLSGTLDVGGMAFLDTDAALPVLRQGWAEVIASGRLGISVVIQRTGTDIPRGEVALAASAPASSATMPFDNTNGMISTIALVNSNPTRELTVSLTAWLPNGQTEQSTVTIGPHGHQASSLGAIMPALAGTRGILQITAPLPDMSVLGLRFTPGGAFTTLPLF